MNPQPPADPARTRVIDCDEPFEDLARAITDSVAAVAQFEKVLAVGASGFGPLVCRLDKRAHETGAEATWDLRHDGEMCLGGGFPLDMSFDIEAEVGRRVEVRCMEATTLHVRCTTGAVEVLCT